MKKVLVSFIAVLMATGIASAFGAREHKAIAIIAENHLTPKAAAAVREAKLPLTRLDEQVSAQTAPAFLFSTCEDALVPSQNALNYALAMARNQIPYELHVYKNGPHGVSTAKEEINAGGESFRRDSAWMDDCAAFFRDFTAEKA